MLIPAKTPFTDEITLCCIIIWMKFVVDTSLLALTKYLRREGFILVQFKGSSFIVGEGIVAAGHITPAVRKWCKINAGLRSHVFPVDSGNN